MKKKAPLVARARIVGDTRACPLSPNSSQSVRGGVTFVHVPFTSCQP